MTPAIRKLIRRGYNRDFLPYPHVEHAVVMLTGSPKINEKLFAQVDAMRAVNRLIRVIESN